LANGSRLDTLPADEGTVRGYSGVSLLVIDEASRVPDELVLSVRPMLATTNGRIVALSTPFIRAGWFFDSWYSAEPWHRIKVTANDCPRISADFLRSEREHMGEKWYRQEYLCEFQDAVGSCFDGDDVRAAFAGTDTLPLFGV
jgi:hypothetical protein